jgi:hypothetical protein
MKALCFSHLRMRPPTHTNGRLTMKSCSIIVDAPTQLESHGLPHTRRIPGNSREEYENSDGKNA